MTQKEYVLVRKVIDTIDPATFDYGEPDKRQPMYCLLSRTLPNSTQELEVWAMDRMNQTDFAYLFGMDIPRVTGVAGLKEARRRLNVIARRAKLKVTP